MQSDRIFLHTYINACVMHYLVQVLGDDKHAKQWDTFAEEARSNFQPGWLRRLKRFADHNHASRRISKRIHGNDQAQGDYGNVFFIWT